MRIILFILCCSSSLAMGVAREVREAREAEKAAAQSERVPMNLEDLKMRKRFGIGMSAAGPLSMLGVEADVNLSPELSISAGLGTGVDYSTFMVKARYFLLGEWVSPYFGTGVARWWTDGTRTDKVAPSVLANRFLEPGTDLTRGFNVWMFYPCVGVQFMHPMGVAVFAELHYLFRMMSLASGTYAGLGMHWYF